MKLQPLTLPPERALKELKLFASIGCACAIVGLFVLWPLGIAGLAFGARALILGFHQSNKTQKATLRYRVLAIAAIVLGVLDIAGGSV